MNYSKHIAQEIGSGLR